MTPPPPDTAAASQEEGEEGGLEMDRTLRRSNSKLRPGSKQPHIFFHLLDDVGWYASWLGLGLG